MVAVKKPVMKKPAAKKPVAKKPVVKKPAVKKPVAKKPAVKRIVRALPLSGYEPKFTWEPWGSYGQVHDNCYDYAFGSYSTRRPEKSTPGARRGIGSWGLTFTNCKGITERILKDNPKGAAKLIRPTLRCPPEYYKVMCFVAPHNDFYDSTGDFHFLKQVGSVRYRIRPGDTVKGLAQFFHVHPGVILRAARMSTVPITPRDGWISNESAELRNLDQLNEVHRGTTQLRPNRIIEFPVNLWAHKQGWAGGPIMIDASGNTIVDPRKANLSYHPGFQYTKFCSAWAVRRGVAETGKNSNR
jgi:hypothetical protein